MRILLTGASGFLGRAVWEHFSRNGLDTTGVSFSQKKTGTTPCDLRDPHAVGLLLEQQNPDVVIHSAAYRDPDFCEQYPGECRRLNVGATDALCRSLPPGRLLIFISTDYVFDGRNPLYAEDAPRSPVNVYGESKREAEDIVRSRREHLVLRVPVLIGAGPDFERSGFLSRLIRAAYAKEPVVFDHTIIRRPTGIRQVADVLAFCLDRNVRGVLHYSGEEKGTPFEWAVRAAHALKVSSDHLRASTDLDQRPAVRPRDAGLCTDTIRGLGFDRFSGFDEALQDVYEMSPWA